MFAENKPGFNNQSAVLVEESDLVFVCQKWNDVCFDGNANRKAWKAIKVWSNYSDLTRPHPKWWFSKGHPLISGKSRLVKYYNLAIKVEFCSFIVGMISRCAGMFSIIARKPWQVLMNFAGGLIYTLFVQDCFYLHHGKLRCWTQSYGRLEDDVPFQLSEF